MLRANAYDESKSCIDWVGPRMSMLVPAGRPRLAVVTELPRIHAAHEARLFSLDRAMEAVTVPLKGSN